MEEIKVKKIEVRLTAEEKDKLKAYADKRHMTMSEVIRVLCAEVFQEEVNNGSPKSECGYNRKREAK